jgi:hypothetical protein
MKFVKTQDGYLYGFHGGEWEAEQALMDAESGQAEWLAETEDCMYGRPDWSGYVPNPAKRREACAAMHDHLAHVRNYRRTM